MILKTFWPKAENYTLMSPERIHPTAPESNVSSFRKTAPRTLRSRPCADPQALFVTIPPLIGIFGTILPSRSVNSEAWRSHFVSLYLVFRYLLHPFYVRPHQLKPSLCGLPTEWWFTGSDAFERNIFVSALQLKISKFAEAVVEWWLNNAVGLNKRHCAKWETRVMILA